MLRLVHLVHGAASQPLREVEDPHAVRVLEVAVTRVTTAAAAIEYEIPDASVEPQGRAGRISTPCDWKFANAARFSRLAVGKGSGDWSSTDSSSSTWCFMASTS